VAAAVHPFSMHHPPVQRRGLGLEERELLELHAEGWSSALIASMLGLPRAETGERLRSLCAELDIAPRPDGYPPVLAARMWLVDEARHAGGLAA
jgi:hypothetical protein